MLFKIGLAPLGGMNAHTKEVLAKLGKGESLNRLERCA